MENLTNEIKNLKLGALDSTALEKLKKEVKHEVILIGRMEAAEDRGKERGLVKNPSWAYRGRRERIGRIPEVYPIRKNKE